MSVSPVPSIEKSSLIEVSAVVLEIAFLRIIYSPVLFLIESAWAVNASAFANVIISFDTLSSACSEYCIMLDLLIKSYTPNGDQNVAVPLVGKVWFGPAT